VISLLEETIDRVPPPYENSEACVKSKEPLKAFLFDAKFVTSRGVSCLIKIMSGTLNLHNTRSLMSYHRSKRYDIFELGIVQPNMMSTGILTAGQVGYFVSNMKSVADAHIGDTFYEERS